MEGLTTMLPKFLLVLLRAGIFTAMLPLISSKSFPARFKIGFALAMAFLITPIVEFSVSSEAIPLLVMRELILGIALGAAARAVFFGVEIAGQLMSTSMGLSIATVFNPEIGQSTEVARFYGILATLVVFATNAHHDLISVFVKSYEWLPVGDASARRVVIDRVVSLTSGIFLLAVKIAAPVLVGMLAANVLLGFISKAAPQMNIFFVSFPVYVFLGFVIMLLSLPVFVYVFSGSFSEVKGEMLRILTVAKG